MSRQDADDEETSPENTQATEGDGQEKTDVENSAGIESDTGETDGEDVAAEEPGDESLEEIAEEPTADVEEALDEVTEAVEESDDEIPVDDDVIEFVEAESPETVAEVIGTLQAERAELAQRLESEQERADDLKSRLSRKQADFQNYKKRQKERMEEEKQRATEDLVERLLDVRDNLARALEQDEDADIRGGVESTLAQFDQELDRENVEVIEPQSGDTVDPQRHEVLITVESDEPEDTIARLHRPGYEMAGKVLRPAQVAVSDGSGYEGTDDADEESAGSDETETDDE